MYLASPVYYREDLKYPNGFTFDDQIITRFEEKPEDSILIAHFKDIGVEKVEAPRGNIGKNKILLRLIDSKNQNIFAPFNYANVIGMLNQNSFKELKRTDKTLNRLKNKAQKYNELMGVIMYMGMPQMNITQLQNLRKKNEQMKVALEKHGIEVRFKYNENLYKGGMKEHGVDLSIGYTIIEKALENSYEKTILISGDADFVPVITKLKECS